MNRGTRLFLMFILTILVLTLIAKTFDLEKIFDIFKKIDLGFFLLAVLSYLVVNFFMSLRIKKLLEEMGCKQLEFQPIVKANFGGMLASDFTPARSGYFLTAFLISSENEIEIDKTLSAIFGPQLLEFAIKIVASAILAAILLSTNAQLGGNENWKIIFFGSLIFIGGVVGILGALLVKRGLLERFVIIKRLPMGSKLYYLIHLMRDNSDTLIKRWKIVLLTTFGAWFFKGLEWYFLSLALNLHPFGNPLMDLGFFMLLHSFLTLTHFLPLPTFAGAGATEATGAALFVVLGLNLEQGISFSLLTRFLMILVDIYGIGAIIPIIKKESFEGLLSDIENIEKRVKNEG